jgi:hypothetical protein
MGECAFEEEEEEEEAQSAADADADADADALSGDCCVRICTLVPEK